MKILREFLTIVSAGISALLLIFSLGCGLSLGALLTRYRQREIGLYRALGWSRRKLSLQDSAQLGLLGLIAGVGGTLVGVGLSLVVSILLRGATFWGLSFSSALEVPPHTGSFSQRSRRPWSPPRSRGATRQGSTARPGFPAVPRSRYPT
ncbi:FtsX-like permease family protein [Microbacterium sp. RG1]|uniref:FtsX-like permease family protein n=1 Tax=Microbacterium sp. RG1 TaxID=2489212 RepID=UPI0010CA4906|nr:ABC transporter permease [Microbacterium sp. RG1]QCQ15848.1 ABC transporter permease [Microbacterium sp. RG1]